MILYLFWILNAIHNLSRLTHVCFCIYISEIYIAMYANLDTLYLLFNYHHWIDTSAGGLLVPSGISHPIFGTAWLTYVIRYYLNLNLLNNVIITKTNVYLTQAYHRYKCCLNCLVPLVSLLTKIFNMFSFPILSVPDDDYSRNTSCALNRYIYILHYYHWGNISSGGPLVSGGIVAIVIGAFGTCMVYWKKINLKFTILKSCNYYWNLWPISLSIR